MNCRSGAPFCESRGTAESARVTMPPVHRLGCPPRHCAQLPQNPDRQATTWSPGLTEVTSAPTASTTPAPSWPSTIGRSSGKRPTPSTTWRSLWHTPVAAVRTSTSRPHGLSISTDSIVSGACVLRKTAAFISITLSSLRQVPADPVADAAAHHQLRVAALEPRELFREQRHALPVRARHARDIRAPEHPRRAERVEDALELVVDVAERIGLRGIARRAGRLDRNVRMPSERQHLWEVVPRAFAGLGGRAAAEMIDDQLQARVTLGDLANLREKIRGEQRNRQARTLGGGPEPVNRAV